MSKVRLLNLINDIEQVFSIFSHKYTCTRCSTKICYKVAFNDIYNKQIIFQHPVINFNMEIFVKIVNDFKQ